MAQPTTNTNWQSSFNTSKFDIRIVAVLISCALSLYAVIFEPTRLNADAYTYIKAAEIFIEQGTVAAFDHYLWAGYSIFLGYAHQLLGIGIVRSALLLNTIFYALIVYSFISIVMEIRVSRKLAVIAAITILIYPQLQEYRYMITRDPAYWGLCLLALWRFILFTKYHLFKDAIVFTLSTLVAASFRPEGLVLLFLLPVSLLFNQGVTKELRRTRFLKMQLFSFLSLLVLIGITGLAGVNLVGNLLGVFDIYAQFVTTLGESNETVSQVVFSDHARAQSGDFIELFLTAGLVGILLVKIMEGLTYPYLLVILYGLRNQFSKIPQYCWLPIITYLLITVSTLLGFILVTRFLSTRYTMLFSLVAILFVPVIIATAYEKLRITDSFKSLKWLMSLLIVYSCIDTYISFNSSKSYYLNAASWLTENVNRSTTLVTNSQYLAFESGIISNYDKVAEEFFIRDLEDFSAHTVLIFKTRPELDQWLQQGVKDGLLTLEAEFSDDDEPKIVAYQRTVP